MVRRQRRRTADAVEMSSLGGGGGRLLAVERLVDGARTVVGDQGLDLLGACDRRVARQRKRARHGVH